MPPPFRRTAAALGGESPRLRWSVFAIAVALAGAWAVWFVTARVTIYATSEDARLEIDRAPHPVEATVGGRVIEAAIRVGQQVKRGDTLIALDPQAQSLQVGEARTRVSGLRPQLERVHAEVAERQRAREQERAAAAAARAEARARYDEARAAAEFADDNERRLTKLFEDQLSKTSSSPKPIWRAHDPKANSGAPPPKPCA
jgi:multidrug resistance efflux pump